jgi:hypothetical protein
MRTFLLAILVVVLVGCSGVQGGSATKPPVVASPAPTEAAAASDPPAPSALASPTFAPPPSPGPGMARLEPDGGAYFGLSLDWGSDLAAHAAERLGRTPSVWVQFAPFPLDEGSRTYLEAFVEQVAEVGGMAVITLEPHDGLDAVTPAAAADLADLLAGWWTTRGVATFVRFAHEMNGSWYPWSQDPEAYVAAFRLLAEAVHERSPGSAMLWAPNQGGGYPFGGGPYAARAGSPAVDALDTDGDGQLTGMDDPYAPYYPGDDAVDWVGMSLYHWGLEHPWGENELPQPETFAAMLRGRDVGAHHMAGAVPDFYATYAEGHDRPLAIVETGILYDPGAADGPAEAELKRAWFEQVFGPTTPTEFPRIRMLNWFEWRKDEPEVGRVIDWRLGSDPALARELLDATPNGWLRFAAD